MSVTIRRPRVLVVEDDPDLLVVLRVNLTAAGLEPILAGDGRTAISRIQAERPDAVVLDVMLPGIDGWSVLEDLHAMGDPVPIVVCSAKKNAEDMERARASRRIGLRGQAVRHRPPPRRCVRGGPEPVQPAWRRSRAGRRPRARRRPRLSSASDGLRILGLHGPLERPTAACPPTRARRPDPRVVHAAGGQVPARVPEDPRRPRHPGDGASAGRGGRDHAAAAPPDAGGRRDPVQ